MSDKGGPSAEYVPEDFLDEPTRDLAAWRWLWDRDVRFPVRSHRGPLGAIIVFLKRLVRPLVTVPQNDLWERQRAFNLILLETQERLQRFEPLLAEIDQLRWNAQEFKDLSVYLTRFIREGVDDIVGHNDALYARVDQKVDRYRRETRRLWSALGSALAEGESEASPTAPAMAKAWREHEYLELEERYRGTEEEISTRFAVYLDHLPGTGVVLDLGCGRGETLELLRDAGYEGRGFDASRLMVEQCRAKGLEVEQLDLIAALEQQEEASVAAVVSLHVIEHLQPVVIERLVRLAWRALQPGGVLILETPNPLSMVVAARNFWLDPTHHRPVHPESLEVLFDAVGFDSVRRLEMRAFSDGERLPEISLDELEGETKALGDQINRLRDRLDDLLFGYQDYGLVGVKPTD
jgi:SAM-dependent methyltransferase